MVRLLKADIDLIKQRVNDRMNAKMEEWYGKSLEGISKATLFDLQGVVAHKYYTLYWELVLYWDAMRTKRKNAEKNEMMARRTVQHVLKMYGKQLDAYSDKNPHLKDQPIQLSKRTTKLV